MASRSFRNYKSKHEHLVRPRTGLSGELYGLRSDVDAGLANLEGELGDPEQALVAEWYIDQAAGDDLNDGSASAPLASNDELMRRLRGQVLDQYTKVTIVGDLDHIYVSDIRTTENGYLHYTATPTVLYSGSLTTVTQENPAANQSVELIDAALVGEWIPFIDKRIKLTSGANVGALSWLLKNLGGNTARACRFFPVDTAVFPIASRFAPVDALAGDLYDIEELPTVSEVQVASIAASGDAVWPATHFRVTFENLRIPGKQDGYNIIDSHTARFVACELGSMEIKGAVQMDACFFTGHLSTRQARSICFGGAGSGCIISSYGGGDAWLRDMTLSECVYIFISGGSVVELHNTGIIEGGLHGLWIGPRGVGDLVGELWGAGNVGYGIRVDGGGSFGLGYGNRPTITGTLGDWHIGADTVAHAGVPHTAANTANVHTYPENA